MGAPPVNTLEVEEKDQEDTIQSVPGQQTGKSAAHTVNGKQIHNNE